MSSSGIVEPSAVVMGFWVIDPAVGSMVVALSLACLAGKLPMHSQVFIGA